MSTNLAQIWSACIGTSVLSQAMRRAAAWAPRSLPIDLIHPDPVAEAAAGSALVAGRTVAAMARF